MCDRIEEATATFGLDDRAVELLRAMDPDDATELLDSVGPGVKNPSAYISKAANDRAHGKGKIKGAPISRKGENGKRYIGSIKPAPGRRVENEVRELGLDERASDVLTSMPPSQALELIDSIPGNVRNLSAYITKAVNDRARGKGPAYPRVVENLDDRPRGKGQAYPRLAENPLSRRLEDAIRSFGLDDKASDALHNMDPSQAVELLDTIPANVRNVSAYITKAVNDRARGKGPPPAFAPQSTFDPQRTFAPQRIDHELKMISDQVEQAVYTLGLDSRAASTLRDMDPWQAAELLDSIPPSVRNASAYITKAVNDRMHQPPSGAFVSMARPVVYAAPPVQRFIPQPMHTMRRPREDVYGQRPASPVFPMRRPREDAYLTPAYGQYTPAYPVTAPALPIRRPKEDAQKAAEVEAQIEALQLDEKASNLLRSLAPMDATGLLESMPGEVRNPSAFISKAANDRLRGKVDVEDRRWKQVTALAEELGLDDRAKQVVMELPATEAYRVLANCREKADSVKNPSAYVLKGVAAVQREMDPHSKRRRMA